MFEILNKNEQKKLAFVQDYFELYESTISALLEFVRGTCCICSQKKTFQHQKIGQKWYGDKHRDNFLWFVNMAMSIDELYSIQTIFLKHTTTKIHRRSKIELEVKIFLKKSYIIINVQRIEIIQKKKEKKIISPKQNC